jgi:hypothetical protein
MAFLNIKVLCSLFTQWQSLPNFPNPRIVISITFSSPQRWYFSSSKFFAVCLLTESLSLTLPTTIQRSVSQSALPPPLSKKVFLYIEILCRLFTRWESLPNFPNPPIAISITVSSPERSYILYIQMPSPTYVYHYGIDLVKVFPSGAVQVYLWKFWCGNIVLLTVGVYGGCNIYCSNTTVTAMLMQILIINCQF